MTYIPNVADTNRQASAVAFLESMQSKIELLMKAGDVADYKRRREKSALIDSQMDVAMKLWEEGQPVSVCSAQSGINYTTLSKRLRTMGKTRGRAMPPEIERQTLEAIQRKAKGERIKDIAAEFGIPQTTLGDRIRAYKKKHKTL